MPLINLDAVLNPLPELKDHILDYIPRATTSKFGIVALGSGINVDSFGRISLDTQEYSNRLTAIETTAASTLETTVNTLEAKADELAASITQKLGTPNGIATLDSAGSIPSSQLPSYVDDVLEYENVAAFPATGETGKIYVETTGNTTYRWSGATYVKITAGEVSSVAGKKGIVTLTKDDVGLSNVDNTNDLSKPLSTAAQTALTTLENKAKRGIINLYAASLIYGLNERVVLTSGDIVKSTIDGNANDPNVNMTGWVKTGEIVVSSIAKLIAIPNPRKGSIANVLSYLEPILSEVTPYKGGGRFVYDDSKSALNDGVLLFNGWVRVKNYTEVDPYMAGAVGNGETDDSYAFQKLIDATAGNFTIGSVGEFEITKALGFPTVSIQGHGDGQAGRNLAYKMKVTGYGATIIVRSAEAIFTSARSLLTPDSTSDLYTGKIEFNGLKFRGDNVASVVFNGDRLYNSRAINCEFSQCSKVLYSYRPKISHPQGYMQSFSLEQNQFMLCAQIVDAKRAYNFRFLQNDCEVCIKGIYIDGDADPALNACRIDDNMFEGGGMFLKLGAVLGGSIRGNYLEANYQGDTVTSKCHIDIRRIATGGLTSGLIIDGNALYATAGQKTDVDWVDIRYSGPTVAVTTDNRARPVLISNYTNSYSLISENMVTFQIGNSAPNLQRSKIPEIHVQHRVDFKTTYQNFTSDTHLSAGVHTVAQLDVAQIRAMTGQQNRPQTADLNVLIQCRTAGGVVVGAAAAKFLIVVQGDEGSGSTLNEAYLGASLVSFAQIPEGLPLSQSVADVMKIHFTNPVLSVVREGDKYLLKLSGYATKTNPNFGSASQLRCSLTLTGYGANNGTNILPMLRF